jgi:hypothetical protein
MRVSILISFLILLCSCGEGRKTPEGYIEECYGGDFSRNMIGKTPNYSAVLDLETSKWEELRTTLKNFANDNGLRFFEDIRQNDSLNMFNVSLCSKDGLWINADKRIWTVGDSSEHIPMPLMIRVQVYKNTEKWASISDSLNSILAKNWPNDLNTEHGYTSSYKNSLY